MSEPAPDARRALLEFVLGRDNSCRSTFRVIREHASSTRTHAGHVIEPTENTAPPLSVSWYTISAPPPFGFIPFASNAVPAGEAVTRLSVSWPDAPPGHRSCRLRVPKTSPILRPVPSNAQWESS